MPYVKLNVDVLVPQTEAVGAMDAVRDYKNPLHLDVVDRYLRRMGDKTIPDEAPPSLESFYPPWVAGIDLPQSRCCGFFVSFPNKHKKVVF